MKEEQSFAAEEQEQQETTAAESQEPVNEAGAAEAQAEEMADQGQDELARLKTEVEETQQRFVRAQADFDNFRRRTQKEKEELAKYASMKLVTELVPVIDNFERAMATVPEGTESESFSKGIQMIFRQLETVLNNEGLTAMDTVGQPFNPEFHQAIMQVESDEYEEGTVVEEVQKGYMLKDKVLRPAMVKVSS
ncbi:MULTISPECIES: nucleotide exchange factor GrpE [Paenibacillus]|uniref:Protein GrpE n=1 Tax=Paenibacillus illinoisensis TaxID=59845 RepID=A0A2W0C671_9BACL|nr:MULTISPECIES: nucleotide exchange factor GrpE [Paenibacillus]MBM6387261.1 nucleotide exchange factor GrpE [Paenibacillus sp.]MBE7682192.1 nucleotide exchange factor GrpE [Paenibacillus sp. P13VS]MBY0216422.1 nucleotide exchange factor GrpE [Paenibacillus illinoisensis]MCM3206047.1 nucleotide exchange factor GrpE [Paenibacillus illinoisensis]PAD30841.1 nucleotide exchange factor GrpE [Paenibacillus sp. 7523-1]